MCCHNHERKDIGTAIGNEIIKDMEQRNFKFELGQIVKHITAGDEEAWSKPLKFAIIGRGFWQNLDGTESERYICSASHVNREKAVERVEFDACELIPF